MQHPTSTPQPAVMTVGGRTFSVTVTGLHPLYGGTAPVPPALAPIDAYRAMRFAELMSKGRDCIRLGDNTPDPRRAANFYRLATTHLQLADDYRAR